MTSRARCCGSPSQTTSSSLPRQVAQQLRENGYDPRTRDVSGVFQMYCGDSNEDARQHGGVYLLRYFKFFDALGGRRPHTAKAFARYQRRPGSGFTSRSYEEMDDMHLLLIGDLNSPEKARMSWLLKPRPTPILESVPSFIEVPISKSDSSGFLNGFRNIDPWNDVAPVVLSAAKATSSLVVQPRAILRGFAKCQLRSRSLLDGLRQERCANRAAGTGNSESGPASAGTKQYKCR